MGGSHSAPCGVFVDLDKYNFFPGEVISGSVHLDVRQMCQIQAIQLKLTGYEKTEWRKVHVRSEHNKLTDKFEEVKTTEDHCGRHDFFKTTIQLGASCVFVNGQYSLPFQVKLPDFLPGKRF